MEDATKNVDMDLEGRSAAVMQDMNLMPMAKTAKISMSAAEDYLNASRSAATALEDILVLADSDIP